MFTSRRLSDWLTSTKRHYARLQLEACGHHKMSMGGVWEVSLNGNSLQQYLCGCVCVSVVQFMCCSILFPIWDAAEHINLVRLFTPHGYSCKKKENEESTFVLWSVRCLLVFSSTDSLTLIHASSALMRTTWCPRTILRGWRIFLCPLMCSILVMMSTEA